MPLPSVIQRLYSFTGFQQSQGDNAFPGTSLDSDLDQTNNALNQLTTSFKTSFREDGGLANGSVGRNALAADIRIGFGPSRPWVTGSTYAQDATVTFESGLYQAKTAHIAAPAFATDLAAARWELIADLSQAVVVADGGISTEKLTAGAVTEPKLSDGAVSSRALGPNVVTRAKAALNLGTIPVGGEIDFAGLTLPAGWQFCAGQELSRTAYAELFEAITLIVTAATTIGSTTLTLPPTVDYSGFGIRGAQVEGPGISPGTIVIAAAPGAIALSAPATGTVTEGSFRILPWGRGNGTSTFNVPDRRGRVTAGRDDMSGVAAARLLQPFDARLLNGVGGAANVTLSLGQLPTFTPAGTIGDAGNHFHELAFNRSANGYAGGGGLGGIVHIGDENAPNITTNTRTTGLHSHTFTGVAIGNGEAHPNVQPTGVANRIIFAGV